VLSSAAGLMEIRAQAERDSGIGLKLFGFIAESVFTFIPECCSRSSRNSVRNHSGIAFTFLRIPQVINVFCVPANIWPCSGVSGTGHAIAEFKASRSEYDHNFLKNLFHP
jgi:hypothetical protein